MSEPIPAERWRTLEPLIDAAVDLSPAERRQFLSGACGNDMQLLAELEQLLLEYDRGDTLLDHPAGERFAALLDDAAPPPELVDGKYRIERKIGQGGMATVYLAHDTRHDRKVAVKILHPDLTAAFRAEQFLAEIRTMAQLRHPHILPLHDSGEADGLLFYVMPYIEGETLRQRLERESPLSLDEVVRITREVASALDSAHKSGVIHCDIKPENILLDDGGALVADFGIAQAVSTATSSHAKLRLIAGTPHYMSPEQMSVGATIDGRADVFALASVAYEMLVGHPPSTPSETRQTSPHSLRPMVPAATDEVIARALATSPLDRQPTAGQFAAALQQALAVGDGSATLRARDEVKSSLAPADARATIRWGAILAVAVAIAAAVLGVRQLRRASGETSGVTPSRAVAVSRRQLTRNAVASDAYQRGLDLELSRSDSGVRLAIEQFKRAIAADSTFAAAYAELAHVYAVACLGGGLPSLSVQEAADSARESAGKAVSVDASLAVAFAELGFVSMFVTYDMPSAEAALKRALSLDPGSARVHEYLADLYLWTERSSDALIEARRADKLDSVSVDIDIGLARALYGDGHFDDALAHLAKLRAVRPPVAQVSAVAADIYMTRQMWDEALRELGAERTTGKATANVGRALALAGKRDEAMKVLSELIAEERAHGGNSFGIAIVYEGLGDYDNAFAWIDKSIADRSLRLDVMSPTFDQLRADPRFDRIRQRLSGE